MLQYASIEAACGSVSFPASRGRPGWGTANTSPKQRIPQYAKCEVVWPPPRSSPTHGGGRCCNMRVLKLHVAASPSPLRGEGRDGGQRIPHQSSEYLSKLSARSFAPTSVLPHTWGRKMLQYASSKAACGSVSFPASRGRPGWGTARRGQRTHAEIRLKALYASRCLDFSVALYANPAA